MFRADLHTKGEQRLVSSVRSAMKGYIGTPSLTPAVRAVAPTGGVLLQLRAAACECWSHACDRTEKTPES